MRRFLIKKLIVISKNDKKSKELNFENGLNIIIGKNKTGKSSLIKSVFHTLGCEVKMEPSWKKLIDYYLVQIQYGDRIFEILRQGKEFKLVEKLDDSLTLLISTNSFHDFCDYLTLKVFQIEFPVITRDLKQVNVTTPILWRFQYIDQDAGWNKIAESFSNMKYIANWKKNSNKYIVGYQGEDYYKLKKQMDISKNKLDNLKTKLAHYKELLEHIHMSISPFENDLDLEGKDFNIIGDLIKELEILSRKKINLEEKLSELNSLHYEKRVSFKALKTAIKELEADHQFACKEDGNLICPFCGSVHQNGILERTEIIKDVQTGNKLISLYREEINELQLNISKVKKSIASVDKTIKSKTKLLENNKDGQYIVEKYKNEGKQELIKISNREEYILSTKIHNEIIEIDKINYELNAFSSRKRGNEIKKEFSEIYSAILSELNVPISFLKLSDFVQLLNNTGSETPRIIYAYHIALYLFNLKQQRGIFNWLVVDTPNQQGQDDKNLKYIDNIMHNLLNKDGQFILGTERDTGFEDKAENVITLIGYKSALNSEKYDSHKSYLQQLLLLEESTYE